MNTKLRSLYLVLGFGGLLLLIYHAIVAFPEISPANVLAITLPDMLVFYLAYKTYPVESPERSTVK